MLASLLVGMAGYRYYERLPWLDAFLNAAMLLGGMGPVEDPQTAGGKLFAGLYALCPRTGRTSTPAQVSLGGYKVSAGVGQPNRRHVGISSTH